MARNDCRTWLKPFVALPALLALLLVAVTFSGTSAVRAQDATPAAGGAVDDAGEFEIIRTAISTKFKVNLKPVTSYILTAPQPGAGPARRQTTQGEVGLRCA